MIFGIFVVIMLALIVFSLAYLFRDPDYEIKSTQSTSCDNGGKLTAITFPVTNGDGIATLIYFKNQDKKIYLNDTDNWPVSYSDLEQKNFGQKFTKFENNSHIDNFPVLDFLEKDLQFEILDTKNFDEAKKTGKERMTKFNTPDFQYEKEKRLSSFYYQLPQTYAIYIDPDLVTKTEFNQIVNCVRVNKDFGKYPFAPANIFVYKKHNPEFKIINCADQKSKITIQANGTTEFKIDGESVYLGYYDEQANFIREKSIDQYFSYSIKGYFGSKFLHNTGFSTAYQESQTLTLLFNEKGEPINDYLQTCKNSEGKNIFEIFKD